MMDKGMIPPGLGDVLQEKDWFHTAAFLGTKPQAPFPHRFTR